MRDFNWVARLSALSAIRIPMLISSIFPMIGFGKKSAIKLFSVAFVLLSVFHAPTAMAVGVGIYAGTFDPPTQSQLRMIRCALGDVRSHRECEDLGKQISRLVVLVNDDIENDTLASSKNGY